MSQPPNQYLAADAPPSPTERRPNRLIHQSSPYLLQHSHNPVDWYPWGDEAFAEARRRDCAIFLSVGYSTCYWCHVMERQVFENPRLAALMNELFVNVKVDREERPDVDDIYMLALQLMTGHGGWPMSLFLTPPGAHGEAVGRGGPAASGGLRPFYAGTYYPPKATGGMPGFDQVLRAVSDAWRDRRRQVLAQAEEVARTVRRHLERPAITEERPLDAGLVQRLANELLRGYDHEHGGFAPGPAPGGERGGPKFPQPANLLFLLRVYADNRDGDLRHALAHTLARMARGGMYDQIAGGFHRYSVDGHWLVPHFEKMLYDNGQLLEVYARAQRLLPPENDPDFFARIVRQTAGYLLGTMTDPLGAFWSAQDAEVNAREGGNYLWSPREIEQAIGEDGLVRRAIEMYGLDGGPNFRDPHHPDAAPSNVLYLPRPLPELAERWKLPLPEVVALKAEVDRRLLAARDERPQPRTDDKVLVNWNGLAIAGLAVAVQELNDPGFRDAVLPAATRAAEAILRHMRSTDGGLYHSMRAGKTAVAGFLDDYANFAHALIELHRATGEARWLHEAQRLLDFALNSFRGGYDTLPDQKDLFVRPRSLYDGALPSGNSQLVHDLLDVHQLTRDERYAGNAADALRAAAGELAERGAGMVHMVHGLLRALRSIPRILEAAPPVDGPSATASGPLGPGDAVVTAKIQPQPAPIREGRAEITVTLDIAPGYHIYSNETGNGLPPTQLSAGDQQAVTLEVHYPPGRMVEDAALERPISIYEGTVELRATLKLNPGGATPPAPSHELVLSFQPCSDRQCLPPQERILSVQVAGAPAS